MALWQLACRRASAGLPVMSGEEHLCHHAHSMHGSQTKPKRQTPNTYAAAIRLRARPGEVARGTATATGEPAAGRNGHATRPAIDRVWLAYRV